MDTLKDYILWTEDLSFAQKPFCEADALALCALVYLDMRPLFAQDGQREIRLKDCLPFLQGGEMGVKMVVDIPEDRELYLAMLRSRRFGELALQDYTDLVDMAQSLQFCALCFTCPQFSFLAYRGTDNSLVGWKEDFMMTFTSTPAQRMAADYAARHIQKGQKPYYLGGHSKGGNLALYAALLLDDAGLDSVAQIYLLDSPGICPDVMDISGKDRLADKVCCILPSFSVIGRLYEMGFPHCKITYSSADGFAQHDLLTWGIAHGSLALAENPDPGSLWLIENLMRWIEGQSLRDRALIVNEFFDALMSEGAVTVQDLSAQGIDGLESILIKLIGASSVTKRAIVELPEKAIFEDHLDAVQPKSKRSLLLTVIRNPVLQCLCLIAIGLTMYFASEHFIEAMVMLALLSVAGLQSFNTLKKLFRSGWNLEQNRERIFISLTMLILCAVVYLKEHALFMIGSLLFGIVCLLLSVSSLMKIKKVADDTFMRGILLAECLATGTYGISFLLAPQADIFVYNMSVGIALVLDGLLRLSYYYVHGKTPL